MRYSVLAGGKRLRPILVIAGAELVGARRRGHADRVRARDDPHVLADPRRPAGDGRRRLPRGPAHQSQGVRRAIAILAGDALLTLAFQLVAQNAALPGRRDGGLRRRREIAEAAGTSAWWAGRWWTSSRKARRHAEQLEYIHIHKTAALLRASLSVGARLGGADAAALAAVATPGRARPSRFRSSTTSWTSRVV
jgi:geranylgeranyl diphosphate synthase type II